MGLIQKRHYSTTKHRNAPRYASLPNVNLELVFAVLYVIGYEAAVGGICVAGRERPSNCI